MKKQVLIVGLLLCIIATVGCRRKPSSNPEAAFSKLSHLATLRCNCGIVSSVKTKYGLTADKGLYRYHGSFLLAFDLTKAKFEHVGQKIYITLPDSKPMSPKIDSLCETYKEERTLAISEQRFNDWIVEAQKEAQEKLVEKAKDPVLMNIARDQARVLIENFYASHFPELTVIVK